jgi:hypothetical protein
MKTTILTCLLLTTHWLASGRVLKVPSSAYPTIQSAVLAARERDTVLVSPGTYFENIRLTGRNIVLTSLYFKSKEPGAIIRKTIIDGSRPAQADTASCILVFRGETSATIIQGFTIQGGKGTIWIDPAGYGVFREGGGILTEGSSPVIRHNIIRDNVVTPGGSGLVSVGGGGIRCGAGAVHIENNQIVHNQGEGYGGGIVLNYCPGAVVRNNIIAYNSGGKDFSGAGFWATGKDQQTVVALKNNTIAYNETPAAGKQYGGKGGGVWVFSIRVNMQNNIVWGNKQPTGTQVGMDGAALQLDYNCIQDASEGTGTITLDPAFRDTDTFVLNIDSPAIDSGDPVDRDRANRKGKAEFPCRGGLRADLGAYGGQNTANPALAGFNH